MLQELFVMACLDLFTVKEPVYGLVNIRDLSGWNQDVLSVRQDKFLVPEAGDLAHVDDVESADSKKDRAELRFKCLQKFLCPDDRVLQIDRCILVLGFQQKNLGLP